VGGLCTFPGHVAVGQVVIISPGPDPPGNPSSGGATGVPYLPTFWRDLGPFLPPRNGYILLHHTIYFGGHGTTEALIIMLAYLAVAAGILGVLDWRRSEPSVPADAAEAAAMAVPIGAAP
jgi:hypothetical protein